MHYSHFLGIDVSKNKLDLSLLDINGELKHFVIKNDIEAIRLFFERKSTIDLFKTLICLEHTGIYTMPVATYLHNQKANIWMETAVKINNSNQMKRGKTDKKDSERIAIYALRYQSEAVLWTPKREVIQELSELMNERERLLACRSILEVPVKELNKMRVATGKKERKESYICTLKRMKLDLKKIEKNINTLIQKDKQLFEIMELTTSVPGVGTIVGVQIIITSNEFKNIKEAKKFACYAGVVPFEKASGLYTGRSRVSNWANKKMKTALHMAALSSIVHHPEMKTYYDRKVEEGKNKMSVLNAIRNKIVKRVFACVRDNRKYNISYTHPLA